jgi:ferric-dicitrate binding protein FerR (iron transport regulator)
VIYEGKGAREDAVLAFQDAVAAKPDHAEALEKLKKLGAKPRALEQPDEAADAGTRAR